VPVFGSAPTPCASRNRHVRRYVVEIGIVNQDLANGPIHAFSERRKGQRWRVNAMQKLIEFYEMVSLNDAVLCGSERMAILKARLALNVFERAMESLKGASTDAPSLAETSLPMAA
jgi:hypothetical protein